MKQIESTPQRPFYSVGYSYERKPWTSWGFTRWWEVTGSKKHDTMQGTDDFELAKRTADYLVTQPGVSVSQVHKSTDCYNHKEVYKVEAAKPKAKV